MTDVIQKLSFRMMTENGFRASLTVAVGMKVEFKITYMH